MTEHATIKSFIRENLLTITLQLVGVVVVIANLWLTTKLAPLALRVTTIEDKLNATDEKIAVIPQNHENIALIQGDIKSIKEDLKEMREDLDYLARK